MLQTIKRIAIGASMVVGASAIATAPAMAGSLTGATIGGTAPSDYYVYGVSGNQTVRVQNPTQADIQNVLGGNAGTPTGNVELRASSEQAGFDFTKNTTLSGTIGGKGITLSSLTLSDWNTTVSGGLTLAQKWFNDALTNNGLGGLIGTSIGNTAYNSFLANGGRQRFTDPNISYVNQNDTTGQVSIGLAGHLNARTLLAAVLPAQYQSFLPATVKASEIVKVSYDGGPAQYLYSFNPTASGLSAAEDGFSHNGNYEVSFQGVQVPEPSSMLGLMALGGLFAATKRKSQKVA